MKINIEIQYKGKIIQSRKILNDEQINNLVYGVGNILYYTLSEMKNDVIKKFLNEFIECGKQSDALIVKDL